MSEMNRTKFYLEKNSVLKAVFACLAVGSSVYRFRISDNVDSFLSLKRDSQYDYLLKLRYKNGVEDEEYWEFKYLFNEYGIDKNVLGLLGEVELS